MDTPEHTSKIMCPSVDMSIVLDAFELARNLQPSADSPVKLTGRDLMFIDAVLARRDADTGDYVGEGDDAPSTDDIRTFYFASNLFLL